MNTIVLRPATIYAVFKASPFLLLAVLFTVAAWCLVPAFILLGVACAGIAFYRVLLMRCTRYTLSTEILQVSTGIVWKRTDHLEWFRVKDYVETQPLLLRLFGLMHLELLTNDRTSPLLVLTAVPCGELTATIRERVQVARRNNPVFEIE